MHLKGLIMIVRRYLTRRLPVLLLGSAKILLLMCFSWSEESFQ